MKTKINTPVNSKNLKVPPIEAYYIKDSALKYKDKPLIDYNQFFFDMKRIAFKGTKKESEKASWAYARQLVTPEFADLGYIPQEYRREHITDGFLEQYPEEYKDVSKKGEKYLSVKKMGEDAYNKAIQKWEEDVRRIQGEELQESWCWNDNRGHEEKFLVDKFPLLYDPITIPSWMFAADTFNEPNFHMTNIEKVALAHAIHLSLPPALSGYYEGTGHVERWCRCGAIDVHRAFISLFTKSLVYDPIPYNLTNDKRIRRWGWKANIPYIAMVLSNYGRVLNK